VPELPEVETVVRDLRPLLVDKQITRVQESGQRLRLAWAPEWARLLVGSRVRQIQRRGKWIVLGLDRGPHLVIHLGMTGQLCVATCDDPLRDHTHLILDLRPGHGQLRFRDVRRFGSARLIAGTEDLEQFFIGRGLGPEPFDLPARYWRERLAATDRCLKAVLLDQRTVAGVGNIYADESLFEASLPPTQRGRKTSATEADRLRRAIVKVLNRAIERRGSTISDYIGGTGLLGGYQNEFRVYGQGGKPCPRCGALIRSIRLAARSTCFCPRCQGQGGRTGVRARS
jgi:formamidopyrimidine-DNA glycosylase